MDVTPLWDIPYSEGSDSADTIDDTSLALAERLDDLATLHGRHAAGTVSGLVLAAAGTVTAAVVFPAGRFSAPPIVVTNITSGIPSSGSTSMAAAWPTAITASGFTMNYRRGTADTGVVAWVAVEA